MLKTIASKHPDEKTRQLAMQNLTLAAHLRGRRDAMAQLGVRSGRSDRTAIANKGRTIYDAGGLERAPGRTVVRSEGSKASNDPAANEAYDGAGYTYDLFARIFKRNSIDGRGMGLRGTVHYGRKFMNAFWDGSQMCYGDGDGRIFNRFTIALDVIAHEMTHGVTQHTANLDYYGEPGALNESNSDIFGSIVKQYARQQSFRDADWLIGAGLLTSRIRGVALRSMKAPGTAYNDPSIGKDIQPGRMRDFIKPNDPRVAADQGGVHTNSGIPNHWFYILCELLQNKKSWEDPGQIAYATLLRCQRSTNFLQYAQLSLAASNALFGANSTQSNAVKKAWSAVDIQVGTAGARLIGPTSPKKAAAKRRKRKK